MTKDKGVPLYRNLVSYLGLLVMLGSAVLIAFALIVQFTVKNQSPYVGIFTYLVFPGVMVLGLLAVLYGMRWEAKRRKRSKGLAALPYPSIDLNDPRQRKIFAYVLVGGVVVTTVGAAALYNGYLYTESVSFCGEVCHVPMEPEHTAYLESPHARVPCVECHVGEGASWYVRSKLSGARQVLAVLFNSYTRPIGTPIEHLRPARETCERCHWPDKFYGAKYLQLPHYRYDETNTAEQISFILKTGGGSKAHGASSGIHWHMIINNKITYAALDKKHLVIPWVRVDRGDGSADEYFSTDLPVSDSKLATLARHRMDCMDCHNRPTHNFPPPDAGIDAALYGGHLSASLPYIKRLAVDSMTQKYADRESAHREIRKRIQDFYREKYPQVFQSRKGDVAQAAKVVISVYDRSVFPRMNVDWRTYPSHLGHRYWPGCFRCHDGRHVTRSGKVLPNDCSSTCHTQPQRGPATPLGVASSQVTSNWHSWSWAPEYVQIEAHKRLLCHDCHKAGERPYNDCGDCH